VNKKQKNSADPPLLIGH